MNVPIIQFAGFSGSGKTTIIKKLLKKFYEDKKKILIIKHDVHNIDLDIYGKNLSEKIVVDEEKLSKIEKDAESFAISGAKAVILISNDKTLFIKNICNDFDERTFEIVVKNENKTLDYVLKSIDEDFDLIIVEGFKKEKFLKIGVNRKANNKNWTNDLEDYIAVITDYEIDKIEKIDEINKNTKVFNFDEEDKIYNFIKGVIMQNQSDFTHFNEKGNAFMVNVGDKPETIRTATAFAKVLVSKETFELIKTGGMKKGDVLTTAQIAGIMAAKQTPHIIPMCHPIFITGVDMDLSLNEKNLSVDITCTVKCNGKTGVEMESLTCVSVAALTVYDMCKAVQKDIVISDVKLLEKTGGVHGDFKRTEAP